MREYISVGISSSLFGRDQKLRVAFRLQDFDNDGLISKEDMR